jgi:hypothetical protein
LSEAAVRKFWRECFFPDVGGSWNTELLAGRLFGRAVRVKTYFGSRDIAESTRSLEFVVMIKSVIGKT